MVSLGTKLTMTKIKKIQHKILYHFPLISRLKCLFALKEGAPDMRCVTPLPEMVPGANATWVVLTLLNEVLKCLNLKRKLYSLNMLLGINKTLQA